MWVGHIVTGQRAHLPHEPIEWNVVQMLGSLYFVSFLHALTLLHFYSPLSIVCTMSLTRPGRGMFADQLLKNKMIFKCLC